MYKAARDKPQVTISRTELVLSPVQNDTSRDLLPKMDRNDNNKQEGYLR